MSEAFSRLPLDPLLKNHGVEIPYTVRGPVMLVVADISPPDDIGWSAKSAREHDRAEASADLRQQTALFLFTANCVA